MTPPVERLVEALIERQPADAARVLEQLGSGEVAALLAELPPGSATAVAARLEAGFAAAVVAEIAPEVAAEIISGLPPAVAALPLRRVPAATADALLAACAPDFAAAVRAVLAAPSRTAGALMDPDAPSLPRDLTASAALAAIRARPARFKHYLYVVDRGGVLVGVTRLLDVVAAPSETQLEDLMRSPVVRLLADEVEVAVLAHPGWASHASLPVVDRGERLVGVLRDDVVRPIRERARASQTGTQVSLALSLAELFWLGLTGVTEGVASVVSREIENAAPEESP